MRRQLERARESLDIPHSDHPAILRIRTQPLPPSLSKFRNHIPFFYHITCTHTHRRTIQIQHVDLYDTYLQIQHVDLYDIYLLLFLIEIIL